MSTVQTPSGKTLPLMNLKGKDYLTVAYRLVWYREVYPKGKIVTEAVQMSPEYAIFRASIFDESECLLATATKHESKKDFPDHIEKAETGAIGRALALCGFGTQFTDDLAEGERIVDSPLPPNPKTFTQTFPVSPQASVIAPKSNNGSPLISEAQVKRFHAIAGSKHLSVDDVKTMLLDRFGLDSSSKITRANYEAACNALGTLHGGFEHDVP